MLLLVKVQLVLIQQLRRNLETFLVREGSLFSGIFAYGKAMLQPQSRRTFRAALPRRVLEKLQLRAYGT